MHLKNLRNLWRSTPLSELIPQLAPLQVDKTLKLDTIQLAHAGVAELADALGSGLSSRKGVRVQVPPSAPYKKKPVAMQVFLILSSQP